MSAVAGDVSVIGIVMVVAFSVEPVDVDVCVHSGMSGTDCTGASIPVAGI